MAHRQAKGDGVTFFHSERMAGEIPDGTRMPHLANARDVG